MALRPYQPPGSPHEFDIVAYDGHDKPVLVVEIKRNGDIRQFDQLVRDTEYYIAHSRRPAPFFLIANPETIYLFKRDGGDTSKPAHEFGAADVLRRYDESYGKNPVYEHYLASLIQIWLNDVADNWRSKSPPGVDVFEQLDLLDAIKEGYLALDASL